MTFWDFFHTHPIHSWIFIVLMITMIHMVTDTISGAKRRKKEVNELKELADKLHGRVH